MEIFWLLVIGFFVCVTESFGHHHHHHHHHHGDHHGSKVWPGTEDKKPCSHNTKQKAMYAQYKFSPSLRDHPLVDVTVQVRWDEVKFAPWNTKKRGKVYAAWPIRTRSVGGYFGVVYQGRGGGKFLFSLWDKRKKGKAATALTWPLTLKTCRRNCLDCGEDTTTGTQCHVNDPDMKLGHHYELRLKRVNDDVTINTKDYGGMPKTHAKMKEFDRKVHGGEWAVSVRNMKTDKKFEVGHMLFEGDGGEVTRIAAFDELVGCTKCDDFYHKDTRFGPFVRDGKKTRTPVLVTGTSNAKDGHGVCRKFGMSGSKSDVSTAFEQGPGTVETFKVGEKPTIWKL